MYYLFVVLNTVSTTLAVLSVTSLCVIACLPHELVRSVASEYVVVTEKLMSRSFLADVLLPVKLSNDLHANLDEAMPLWIAAHGERRALWIRRSQEAQTIAKYWMTPLRNLFQAVFKLIR